MLTCCIIKEMHCAFQMRHAILIRTNGFLVRPHVFEVLDSNMPVETIDASEKVYCALGARLLRLGASFRIP